MFYLIEKLLILGFAIGIVTFSLEPVLETIEAARNVVSIALPHK